MRTAGIVVAVMATVLIAGCSGHDKSKSTSLKPGQSSGTGLPPGALAGSPSQPLPSPTPPPSPTPLPTTLPANCGKPIESPAFPEGWPAVFPLPANLVLTTSTESGGALRITGVSS